MEIELLKKLIRISEEDSKFSKAKKYLSKRLHVLENATDIKKGGLIDDVFLINPVSGKRMRINKNFAFFDFDGYHNTASQADIYFTISSILNNLRHSSDPKRRKIFQEEQVRTIIDPENFIRYDDGIIQASILRSATSEELNYKLSYKHSNFLTSLLIKMIDSHEDHQSSEALIEFLLALSLNRLRIFDTHLKVIIDRLNERIPNPVFLLFASYIKQYHDSKSSKKSELPKQ